MFNLVFTAIDDTPLEAFVWMPAHSTADDVGSLLLGNEAPLSEVDRQSNARADAEAKAAVEAHRVPVEVRRRVKQEAKRVREAAMWLGRVAHLANSHADAPHRDSEGTRWKSRRTGSGGLRRHLQPRDPTVAAEQRPAALGGHVVFRQRSSWLCVVCWRSSSSWDKFAPQRCASSVAEHDSWGHCMMLSGDVHWCLRCGAYARSARRKAMPGHALGRQGAGNVVAEPFSSGRCGSSGTREQASTCQMRVRLFSVLTRRPAALPCPPIERLERAEMDLCWPAWSRAHRRQGGGPSRSAVKGVAWILLAPF